MTTPTTPPRPMIFDSVVIRETVERVLPSVLEWAARDGDEHDPAEIGGALHEAIDVSLHSGADGYQIARELEDRRHWSPDARLVDILDACGSYLKSICRRMVCEWVKTHSIQPAHPVGTRIKYRHHIGRITAIKQDFGEYIFQKNGTQYKQPAYGTLVPYEDAELIQEGEG